MVKADGSVEQIKLTGRPRTFGELVKADEFRPRTFAEIDENEIDLFEALYKGDISPEEAHEILEKGLMGRFKFGSKAKMIAARAKRISN
jgi:hypothetical protein